MNLFFGGSLGGLMRPHFYRRVGPRQLVRSMLRQNILWSASRATALSHELVQRSTAQLNDHNHEEMGSMFTRPTLDLYLCNKYWGFITADELSREELADLEAAKGQLEHYERIYALMEYCSDLSGLLTTLQTRIGSNNPSLPQTVYRRSRHNQTDNIFKEVELCLEAYYGLIEDAKEHPLWVRKIEEELGQNMAFTFIQFDESVRDELVANSHLFKRFDLDKQKFFK